MNLVVEGPPKMVRFAAMVLLMDGKPIKVNWHESVILNFLIAGNGAPVSRETIMDRLYGDDPDGGPNDSTINKYISILRAKLRLHDLPLEIKTHNGVGWSMRRTA